MKRSIAIAFVSAIILAGCATPLPVDPAPPAPPALTEGEIKSLTDFSGISSYQKYYANGYAAKASKLREKKQTYGETGFYSSIVAVVGGIAGSPALAATGGVVAGGSGLLSDRYHIQQQAHNYEAASYAMVCMYLAGEEIKNITHENYELTFEGGDPINAKKFVITTAVDGLFKVTNKLSVLQSSIQLATPDAAKIEQALRQKPPGTDMTPEAKRVRNDRIAALTTAADTNASASANAAKADPSNKDLAQAATATDAAAKAAKDEADRIRKQAAMDEAKDVARLKDYKKQMDLCTGKIEG